MWNGTSILKLLFISFYFTPDLSAGSFRAASLVKALLAKLPENAEIELITTLPNRYHSFSADAPEREEHTGLTIHRVKIPAHRSGLLDQARAYLTFAAAVLMMTRKSKYDLIVVTSGRLMSATLGALLSRLKGTPLYLDIRDIFVDTIKDVLSPRLAIITRPLFSLAEKWTITRAKKVNLVSKGFSKYFQSRYPAQQFSYFTNGIDSEFLVSLDGQTKSKNPGEPFNVTYAGNIGAGQGLEKIVPSLAKRLEGRVHFRIFGDGGRRTALESNLRSLACTNVELLSPVPRKELLSEYLAADILFLHLNDYDAFRKVLPSKLFEYAAVGKPIWAGIAGYSAEFARSEITNVALFTPCDADSAIAAFADLQIAHTPRPEFTAKYSREEISDEMASEICALI